MPRELIVRTPENVEITHSLAGIGSRGMAVIIDHLLQILLIGTVFVLLMLVFSGQSIFAEIWTGDLSGWAFAGFIFFVFLVSWGYFILFETLWNGQTPGKRAMNIRVVKENGRPIDFFASAVRNIVRILDSLPSMYGAGILCMFFSPSYKRIGDYAAGTVVVKEYRPEQPRKPGRKERREKEPKEAAAPVSLPTEESQPDHEDVPGVTIEMIRRVSREEYDAARRYLDRRDELPPPLAGEMARKIAEPILHRLDMTPEDPERYPYGLFLESLTRDYLRQQDIHF